MEELSAQQRHVVGHPKDKGHMLVLAAPGSGKTRTITERVGALLSRRLVAPEEVLVMTFTIKAANELIERLGNRLDTYVEGVWTGTFHSICDRLLHDYGAAIGWGPPFTIYDEPKQEEVLRKIAPQVGYRLERYEDMRKLKETISERKRLGLQGDEQRFREPFDPEIMVELDDAYRRALSAARALDYDDLLLKTIQLLRDDEEAARSIRRRFRYVFVDEFHDVSPEQFELLRRIVPPRAPDAQVMVVADQNQAIYGWRGADVNRILPEFKRLYQPVEYQLVENYRSAGNLVRASQHFLTAGGASASATPVLDDSYPIDCVGCQDQQIEARFVAQQIQRAVATGRYSYGDIAVLYRTHKRGDLAETEFLKQGLPLVRIQKDRFFDDPYVQSTLRYLALIAALHDDNFEPALNWPRVLVDELTMIQLKKISAAANLSLSGLAREIDRYAQHVSPLTRTAIEDFLNTIARDLLPIANQPIQTVVARLLEVLQRRRSPIPQGMREDMQAVLEFLSLPLKTAVMHLQQAIATKRPLAILHAGDVDSAAGAVVLEHVFQHYLRQPVLIQPDTGVLPPDAFVITLGVSVPATGDGFGLGVRDAKTIRFSICTQAWRLGQILLMRYETLRHGRFVIYDFETSGRQVKTTEIIELAAIAVEQGKPTLESFHSLVRPKGTISPDATRVHGIRAEDVRSAPTPAFILPKFLDFLGSDTLVGHNIEQFDHQILCRMAKTLELPPPPNDLIDTCVLARRLLPGADHKLESLAERFGIREEQTHRALDDVRLNAHVFTHLLDLVDAEKELDVLSEALPLVAISSHAAGIPMSGENELLAQAGARAAQAGLGDSLQARLEDMLETIWDLQGAQDWLKTRAAAAPDDDMLWEELSSRWQVMLEQYCHSFKDHDVQTFLRYTALAAPIDYRPQDAERVTMTTIHTAKGMEWPIVFILGVEEGTLPAWWTSKSVAELTEERRVLYVGMTRAKQRLILSWVKRMDDRHKKCSAFVSDIPQAFITHREARA